MTAPLTVRLFGSPQILRGAAPVEVNRRKSRALAFYLAANPGPVARARLLSLFWPDHDRPAAQQSLRTTLHGLRRDLGDALAVTDADLALAADVDARALSAALADPADEGRLAAALRRYAGDFLSGLELPDNPELDDWLTAERERYRRMVIRGLLELARRRAARRDYPSALEALARAAALEPLHEAIQRDAMQIEYLAGDRAAAIRRYEQLRQRLDDELGVPPMAETRALYDAIVTDALPADEGKTSVAALTAGNRQAAFRPASAALQPEANQLPFVGREAELALLHSLAGGPQLALIEGEPGIGKSELARQFITSSGALALAGAAYELEQSLPYQPLIDALRQLAADPAWPALNAGVELAPVWRAEIARLLPELGGSAPPGATDEARVWEAVSQLLQALARIRPVVLFLDDLQWVDTATIGLLAYLARRSAGAPLTLVAATRPVAPRSPLATLVQSLTREGRLTRIPLDRLDAGATALLARAISPNFPDPLAEWLTQSAEGNPYIIVELVRYAREQRLLGPNGTLIPGAPASPIVPRTVESLIQSRLARLSEPARLLLDTAVAAGREFAFEVVAQASALSEAALLDGLDELRAARLVEPLPDGSYRFDHTLTMEVAYREIGEPRHRRLHRRLAEAIEQIEAPQLDEVAGALAWHFAEAGAHQRAAAYALRAARRAAALAAWQEAIGFYRQALADEASPDRLHVLIELGDALVHVGDQAASETYREAIERARAAGNQASLDGARLALGYTLIQQARFAEVIELARQVRENGHPGSAVRAELLWGVALSIEGADLCDASEHLIRAERLSDASADPATRSTIVFELGNVRAQQGDLAEAIALYQQALAYGEQDPGATQQRVLAHNNLGYHMLLHGDPRAEEHARAGLQIVQEAGMLSMQPYLHSTLGEILLGRGDLEAAERAFSEGLSLAERIGIPERIAGLTANLGLVALRRGQTALAVHRLTSALARADALGLLHLAAQIRIWLTPLLPPPEAQATLAAARAVAESGGRQRLLAEIAALEAGLRSDPQ